MRILVISNLYPPHYIGGYELGCRDVVEELKKRGHQVRILTSTYGVNAPHVDDSVYRWLVSDIPWLRTDRFPPYQMRMMAGEIRNRRALRRVCDMFSPDIVYVWNLTYVSISLVFAAQKMGLPVCYFVSDDWLSQWESDSWHSLTHRAPRHVHRKLAWAPVWVLLRALGLVSSSSPDLRHVQFASHYLKQMTLAAAKPVADATVIHWGADLVRLPYKRVVHEPKRLLYVGQLGSHKGVDTAIEAVKTITTYPEYRSTILTVVGGPDHQDRLRQLVSTLGLEDNVRFTGFVSRQSIPAIYQEHDILIFPSVWDEPFSIALLEAMASGLAVVGTNTGGSPEILHDEINGLVFPPGDHEGCARQILRLFKDTTLLERVRRNGRQLIEQQYTLDSMVNQIERSLHDAANVSSTPASSDDRSASHPDVRNRKGGHP